MVGDTNKAIGLCPMPFCPNGVPLLTLVSPPLAAQRYHGVMISNIIHAFQETEYISLSLSLRQFARFHVEYVVLSFFPPGHNKSLRLYSKISFSCLHPWGEKTL